ncbi:MAG: hypothetical protein Q9171_003389 [Xanthocarpia ochracea]
MAVLRYRSEFTDNASAKASSKFNACMSKPMCKWPAILGIILAVLFVLTCIYCLLRCLSCCCCDCLSGGRYQRGGKRRHRHKYADLHSPPYDTAYQPSTANPNPPPGYPASQQPPQYAQFGRTGGDDSLPAMPNWTEAQEKRVYDQQHDSLRKEVEMGRPMEREKEYEQREPMLAREKPHDPLPGYAEMDGTRSGDLGTGQVGGYKPYGQAYAPYSPVAGAGQPQAGNANSWRNL